MDHRFSVGQRIRANRSGHGESLAEVLLVRAAREAYRVRWTDGLETEFVPGPDARDRRRCDLGPPAGEPDRRAR